MDSTVGSSGSLWPLLAFAGLTVVLIGALVGLSPLFGERHREPLTDEPYESGVAPSEFPPGGISIQFYRMAVFFVIFDLETIFIFAWAIALRESGWTGYFEMLVFVGVLIAALVYLWRQRSLDWGTSKRKWLESKGRAPW